MKITRNQADMWKLSWSQWRSMYWHCLPAGWWTVVTGSWNLMSQQMWAPLLVPRANQHSWWCTSKLVIKPEQLNKIKFTAQSVNIYPQHCCQWNPWTISFQSNRGLSALVFWGRSNKLLSETIKQRWPTVWMYFLSSKCKLGLYRIYFVPIRPEPDFAVLGMTNPARAETGFSNWL